MAELSDEVLTELERLAEAVEIIYHPMPADPRPEHKRRYTEALQAYQWEATPDRILDLIWEVRDWRAGRKRYDDQ